MHQVLELLTIKTQLLRTLAAKVLPCSEYAAMRASVVIARNAKTKAGAKAKGSSATRKATLRCKRRANLSCKSLRIRSPPPLQNLLISSLAIADGIV